MEYLDNTFFMGLFGYEKILLVLGVLLFITILVNLIKEFNFKTLPFLVASIIMIGFPAIQEFSYNNGIITVKKDVHKLLNNPSNELNVDGIASLEETISKIEKRAKSEEDIAYISKAYMLIGNPQKAISVIDEQMDKTKTSKVLEDLKSIAISHESTNEQQKDFGKTIQLSEKINTSVSIDSKFKNYYQKNIINPAQFKIHEKVKIELQKRPNDPIIFKEFDKLTVAISETLNKTSSWTTKNMITIAESQVMLEKPNQAIKTLGTKTKNATAYQKTILNQIEVIANFQNKIIIDPNIINNTNEFESNLKKTANAKGTNLYKYAVKPIIKKSQQFN